MTLTHAHKNRIYKSFTTPIIHKVSVYMVGDGASGLIQIEEHNVEIQNVAELVAFAEHNEKNYN